MNQLRSSSGNLVTTGEVICQVSWALCVLANMKFQTHLEVWAVTILGSVGANDEIKLLRFLDAFGDVEVCVFEAAGKNMVGTAGFEPATS